MTKTVYYFKPNRHWNVVKPEVYLVLSRFYSDEYLKQEEVQE